MDYSPLGSSVHGIHQARILEWVAIPFSRGSSWPRDQTQVSCIAGRRFTLWATREAYFIEVLLKSSTIVIELSISLFNSVSFCFMYFRALWLGVYMFIIWRRKWQPTPVFLPGEFHVQRSLADYSPWGHKESDTTERLIHTHTQFGGGECLRKPKNSISIQLIMI